MGHKIPCLFISRRAGLEPFPLDAGGGGLLWFVQEAIAGGQGGTEKWTRVQTLEGGGHGKCLT